MAENERYICSQCEQKLQTRTVDFEYLGQRFQTKLLKCPTCGQAYIPRELAEGKMAEVEASLEDK